MTIITPTPTEYDQTSLRPRTWFHWRAGDLSLEPLAAPADLTIDRTTSGTARDVLGRLYSQQAEHLRFHHVEANDGNTYLVALLEGGSTNELTRSEELDHADWGDTGFSAVTADQATGPDGVASLEELVEDGTTGARFVTQTGITLTADANYAISAWGIANSRDWLLLHLADGGGNTLRAWFNLSTGAVGTTSGGGTASVARTYVENWTDVAAGLYRVVLVGSIGSGSTSINARLYMTDSDDNTSYAGDGTSSLYAGYAMLEDDANFASSYAQTVASTASRDADLLQESDVGFTPKDIEASNGLTILTEFVGLGTAFTGGSYRYWQIGGPGNSDTPWLLLTGRPQDGRVRAAFNDGSAAASETAADTVSLIDHVRARTKLYDKNNDPDNRDWRVRLFVSVNGGAEVDAGDSATIGSTLPDAWSANTLTIGAAPDDTLHGFSGLRTLVFAPGDRSLDYMESIL